MQNRADGVRIVRGELRVDAVVHGQQQACIGQIRHVGEGFAREYREGTQTEHLRALDFRIPIGAFHQTHHDFAIVGLRHGVQMLEHIRRARVIRLHHNTQTFPIAQRVVAHDVLNDEHGEFEALGFFRVNVQPHIEVCGQMCQF